MYIIVKHLNAGITVNDLEDFVKPSLKGGLVQKTAELKAIKLMALTNKEGMIVERHGLIRIAPDREKARIIKSLQGRRILLEKFAIADYVIRHWSNDRRTASQSTGFSSRNRRVNERRRTGLRIVTISEKLKF